jgi:hypothetical protein
MKNTMLGIGAVLAVVVLCGGFYFLGSKSAEQGMSVKRITPQAAAEAMQQDHFYSDNRENTLIVTGLVASIAPQNGHLVVTFKTAGSFKARCQLAANALGVQAGDTVKFLTEGGTAQRQPDGVLLTDCTLP